MSETKVTQQPVGQVTYVASFQCGEEVNIGYKYGCAEYAKDFVNWYAGNVLDSYSCVSTAVNKDGATEKLIVSCTGTPKIGMSVKNWEKQIAKLRAEIDRKHQQQVRKNSSAYIPPHL